MAEKGNLAQWLCHLVDIQVIAFWHDYVPSKQEQEVARAAALPYIYLDTSLPANVFRRLQGKEGLLDVNRHPIVLDIIMLSNTNGSKPPKAPVEEAFKWALHTGRYVAGAIKESHRFPDYLADNSLLASVTISGTYIT